MEMNERQKWLERITGLVGEDAGETPEIIFEAVANRIDELEEQHATDVEREQSLMLRLSGAEAKLKECQDWNNGLNNGMEILQAKIANAQEIIYNYKHQFDHITPEHRLSDFSRAESIIDEVEEALEKGYLPPPSTENDS